MKSQHLLLVKAHTKTSFKKLKENRVLQKMGLWIATASLFVAFFFSLIHLVGLCIAALTCLFILDKFFGFHMEAHAPHT